MLFNWPIFIGYLSILIIDDNTEWAWEHKNKTYAIDCPSIININQLIDIDCHRSSFSSIVQARNKALSFMNKNSRNIFENVCLTFSKLPVDQ